MLKIVLWGPLNNEMAKTVTLGSANLPTVTNLGGSKLAFIYPKTAGIKIAQKRPLKSTEHKNGKEGNFRFGSPLTVTNLGGRLKNCLYLPRRRQE